MTKLHCFGESGHSYKVALALELNALDWEPVFVDFFNGAARSDEYADLNVMAEAPVFDDGKVRLTQSGVILSYLSEQTGKFGGETDDERREILRWILWDNHKFSSQAGVTRFLTNYLPAEKQPEQAIAFLQGRFKAACRVLERQLDGKEFIVGRNVTNADFSCCSYLYYPEPFGFDRKDWPNIDAWLDRIAALPGWSHPYDLMPRSPADRA